MFDRVSEKITENIVKSGTVVSDEKELYLFGVQQGLTILLNIGTTVAVSLLLGVFWQIILFTVAYMALRSFAGGYHASTPQRCYVLSTLITIIVSLLIKYVFLHIFICIGLLIFAGTIIIVFSPIGNENKSLDDLEKTVYKRKAVIICIIEILTAVVFLCLNLLSATVCLMWTLVSVSIMMIVSAFKGKILIAKK